MDNYNVKVTEEATLDLIQIYSYICTEFNSPQYAIKQTDRIRTAIRSLDVLPLRFKIVTFEPWSSMNIRQFPIDNFIIYYSVDEQMKTVDILRIFSSKQDIENKINDW